MEKSELQGSGLGVSASSEFIDYNFVFEFFFKLALDETFCCKVKMCNEVFARKSNIYVGAHG